MIAAIMQPYFFPYIGYFQLMKAVDIFVFYDDAQYMKGGWINRNRILIDGKPAWLTLPVSSASIALPINRRHYLLEEKYVKLVKQRLNAAYKKAPAFEEIFLLVSNLLESVDSNVAVFNASLLKAVSKKLGIACDFMVSSTIDQSEDLRGEAKVIDLCRRIGAKTYINSIGGLALYDAATFAKSGIDLHFLKPNPTHYAQYSNSHVPFLSIIDVLMFNPIDHIFEMINHYQVFEASKNRLT